MKNLYVLLISVNVSNARKVCEHFENRTFECLEEFHTSLVGEMEISVDELDEQTEPFILYPITDFMDAVNNQLMDNLDSYFMSYVIIN